MISLKGIPKDYVFCTASDAACPRAATCLRALGWQALEAGADNDWKFVRTLNPALIARTDHCEHYRDNTPVRFARGMSHLLDNVPLKQAKPLRKRVMRCFSCERYYYYCQGSDRLITPAEQAAIERAFHDAGIAEPPQYDDYEEGYNW